jgi:hypothetical protein
MRLIPLDTRGITIESQGQEKKQPISKVETGLQVVWANLLTYSRPNEVNIGTNECTRHYPCIVLSIHLVY